MATKAKLIEEISELSDVAIEGLNDKGVKELKSILKGLKSTDDESEKEIKPKDKAAKAPQKPKDSPKPKVVGFKKAEVKNSVVSFHNTDGSSDVVSFNKDRKKYVEDIIKAANLEISINSKPKAKAALNDRTRNSAICKIIRIVLNPDKISNKEAKNLLAQKKTSNDELVNAVGLTQLHRIVELYCEIEKTVSLS